MMKSHQAVLVAMNKPKLHPLLCCYALFYYFDHNMMCHAHAHHSHFHRHDSKYKLKQVYQIVSSIPWHYVIVSIDRNRLMLLLGCIHMVIAVVAVAADWKRMMRLVAADVYLLSPHYYDRHLEVLSSTI